MDNSFINPLTSRQTAFVLNGVGAAVCPNNNANIATMIVPLLGTSEHKVVHNYHDHASDADGDYDVHRIVQNTGGSGVEQSFPMKLHYCLNEIELDGLSHIVSWQPHGRCFVVHSQKLFVERILGSWFRQSKIASFQRQLNIYGFQRLTTGPDKGGYYHELFLRSKPGLARRIQRQKLKGTKTRRAASPESEPNFYTMPPMPCNKTLVLATSSSAVTAPVAGACPVSSASPATLEWGGNPDVLTLQKMAPSFFSPAAFETSVHQMIPQLQHSHHPRGLTVTSTCSVTVKPTEELEIKSGNNNVIGGGNGGQFAFPFSTLAWAPASQSAAPSRSTTNNDTFWAALSGGAGIPMAATALRNLEDNSNAKNNNGTSLWLLR